MIRALEKIKSLEEYEEDKKLLTYYLSDRKISNEELSLVLLEEPIVGLKAKASQNANKVTEKCITEFLDSSNKEDSEKKAEKSYEKIQIKREFTNQEHNTPKKDYEGEIEK